MARGGQKGSEAVRKGQDGHTKSDMVRSGQVTSVTCMASKSDMKCACISYIPSAIFCLVYTVYAVRQQIDVLKQILKLALERGRRCLLPIFLRPDVYFNDNETNFLRPTISSIHCSCSWTTYQDQGSRSCAPVIS